MRRTSSKKPTVPDTIPTIVPPVHGTSPDSVITPSPATGRPSTSTPPKYKMCSAPSVPKTAPPTNTRMESSPWSRATVFQLFDAIGLITCTVVVVCVPAPFGIDSAMRATPGVGGQTEQRSTHRDPSGAVQLSNHY